MGCAGHPQVQTPNLDRLASEGTRFTNTYAQNPICTPSRLSILTGQYCHNTGYYGLSGPAPTHLPSWLGHFRSQGYRTAGIGKLHLPNTPRNWLESHVDLLADCYETADGYQGRSPYFDYLRRHGARELEESWHQPDGDGGYFIANDARPARLPYEHNVDLWCARQATEFIAAGDGRPFSIQVAFPHPHHGLMAAQPFWDMYPDDLALPPTLHQPPEHRPPHFRAMWQAFRRQKWDFGPPHDFESGARRQWKGTLACMTQVDDAIGYLVKFLEQHALLESTVIVYGSDHGCYHGIHGIAEKAPGICSDAVCRVPFIWRGPKISRKVSDQLVENIDIASTAMAVCGADPMPTSCGCNLSKILAGDGQPAREVAVTENVWSKALRWGEWRFVHYQPEMFEGQDVGELYNLALDPDEATNLYHEADYREIVEQGRRLLLEWLIRAQRPVTCWPAPAAWSPVGRWEYPLAADGREAPEFGPGARLRAGKLNYL